MVLKKISLNQEQNVTFLILIVCAAALGSFLFGFDTAVMNGAIVAISKAFNTDSVISGFIVACALLGSFLGALIAGQIVHKHGHRKAMIAAAILFTLSGIGSGIAVSAWDLIFWRVLGGVAVGMTSVITPAYIAEVAPSQLRGSLGSLQQLAIVLGIFIALLCNYFIALAAGGSAELTFWFGITAWRWMFWTKTPLAILYVFAALMIPESPRYLISQKRFLEAENVLKKVFGGNVQAKVEEISQTLLTQYKPKLSDLLSRNGGLLQIVWIGSGLSILQQFVGINVIFYYSNILWQAIGFSEKDSLLITMITGIINIVTTCIAIAYVDKIGRKPLLLLGSIGMTITLGTLTVVFNNTFIASDTGNPTLTGSQGIIALLAANLYVVCFGFSWGPIVWVLLGEMFNNKIRAAALSFATAVQWIANFIVSTSFLPLVKSLGLGFTYGFYTIASATSIFFVAFLLRETKGKELEEM
ncbi:MAG: sugar porter family MFS transporter [Nostoc desertorum CM1-VF14]|jgi:SP family sugar:H+ symporter-like MFS transporter|nr:sugar porter family MFS transporter [Nostoc desertorum CM1-VF14]